MLRFLADEDFSNHILRGLLRHNPDVDIVRVQDVGLQAASDPSILTWAADAGRLLITHDANTAIAFAQARAVAGDRMPGVIVVSRRTPIGRAIHDLLMPVECSQAGEWEGRVVFVPL